MGIKILPGGTLFLKNTKQYQRIKNYSIQNKLQNI